MTKTLLRRVGLEVLKPGTVTEDMFRILIDISSIRSKKVINALRGFFVEGKTRVHVCIEHNVNAGYLSIKIKELQILMTKIMRFYPHYNHSMVMGMKA